MAEPDKPVEKIICLISLMAQEEYKLAKVPRVKGILSRVFGGEGEPGATLEGGRQLIFSEWHQQAIDYSTVQGVLGKIGELQEQRRAAEEKHLQAGKRLGGYDYRIGDCLRIWIGTENQFEHRLAREGAGGLREKGAKMLFNAEVTAENIAGVLKNFNTAETAKAKQYAINTAITSAVAPPESIKPMKKIRIRKGP